MASHRSSPTGAHSDSSDSGEACGERRGGKVSRRRFLRAAAALGGVGVAATSLGAAAPPPQKPRDAQGRGIERERARNAPSGSSDVRLDKVGLQIGTIGERAEEDLGSALKLAADIGYAEIEFPRYFGHAPAAVRALLERYGLAAPSGLFDYTAFRDEPGRVIEAAQTAGHRYVVCPYFSPQDSEPEIDAPPLQVWRRTAALFEEVGTRLQAAGLQFAYHCHDHEFKPVDSSDGSDGSGGERPVDLLLRHTRPEALAIEMDFYWIAEAGADPLRYFARYPGRFPLWHVKDRAGPGQQVPVGAGTLDFARLFAHAEQAGLEHFFVEQGQSADPVESIRASYRYLAQLQEAAQQEGGDA